MLCSSRVKNFHDEGLFPDVLWQKTGKIEDLVKVGVQVSVDDAGFKHFLLVGEEEEDDERTARMSSSTCGAQTETEKQNFGICVSRMSTAAQFTY